MLLWYLLFWRITEVRHIGIIFGGGFVRGRVAFILIIYFNGMFTVEIILVINLFVFISQYFIQAIISIFKIIIYHERVS
jgi:hypothetical protein